MLRVRSSCCLLSFRIIIGSTLILFWAHLLQLCFVCLIDRVVLVLSLHLLLSGCDLVGDQVVLGLFHGASASIGYLVGLTHWSLPTTGTILALLVILREIASPHFLVCALVNTS